MIYSVVFCLSHGTSHVSERGCAKSLNLGVEANMERAANPQQP